MKLQELNLEEMKAVNGGGLLDDLNITNVIQGYVGYSHTDEDGQTESGNLSFGLGTMSIFDDN